MDLNRESMVYAAIPNPALDGIRGTAILIVFLSHTSLIGQSILPFLNFGGTGHVGVYLFFSLSAYLVTISFIRDGRRMMPFWFRRACRILPLFYIVVTVTFIVGGSSPGINLHISGGIDGYIKHILFIKGDGALWSIAPEMWFYISVPMLVWITSRFGRVSLIWFAVVAIGYYGWYFLYREGFAITRPTFLIYHLDSQWVDVFLFGVIGALCKQDVCMREWFDAHRKKIEPVTFGLFSVVMVATTLLVSNNFMGMRHVYVDIRWVSLLYGFVFAAFVLVNDLWSSRLSALFRMRLLRYLGLISFSFYLLHLPVMYAVAGVTWLKAFPPAQFVASFIGTVIVSTITFRLIEEPMFRWSKRVLGQ